MSRGESESAASFTRLLVRWRDGDDEAIAQLATLVYAELRRLAGAFLRDERDSHTLQPTALVHELYLQLASVREIDWKCRAQFLAVSARMMRRILTDHARRRGALKRGSGAVLRIDEEATNLASSPDIVLIDEALTRFSELYPRQAQVVELRFFGGLTADETVQALEAGGHEVSLRTVERDWKFSKVWLQNELRPG
jgi:RNA polymerase sigma factor (TIGR02999 family)